MRRHTFFYSHVDLRICVAGMSLVCVLASPAIFPMAVAQTSPASQSAPQKTLTILEQGKQIEREISGKNADGYELPLQPGQFF